MSKTVSDTYPISEFNGIPVNTSLPCASGYYTACSSRSVKYIVMHYTGNSKIDTAKSNASYYHSSNTREASAHYFVDDDSCYQSVSPNNRAWHCGASSYRHAECRNANSIGIEMCCTAGAYTVSDTTIENAAYLCAALCEYVGIGANEVDTYVVRHYDVTGKSCPAQWASDTSAGFTAFKERVVEILSGASAVEEYTDINAIVWELNYRGILSDSDLWVYKCENDTNIYWLCRKLCHYVRTKTPGETADRAYTDYDEILWDMKHRGIISDKQLWLAYMTDDVDVYWLMYKGLHWCRTY